jgi:hypothetical protein
MLIAHMVSSSFMTQCNMHFHVDLTVPPARLRALVALATSPVPHHRYRRDRHQDIIINIITKTATIINTVIVKVDTVSIDAARQVS